MFSPTELSTVRSSGLLDRCSFPAAATSVSCAVSGGADSTALLALALVAGLDVRVVHVDHQLRPTSAVDAALVAALCARWSVPCDVIRVHIEDGPNLEARARAARYDAMPADVLTGHTADDLAETFLLNVLRGAALDGLAPMRQREGGPRRPLLTLRHAETVALCCALGVDVIADAMNHDDRYRRVRVRRELLPLMDSIAARDVTTVIASQVELLRADADLLDALAAAIDPTDALALRTAPVPLASRAIRRWLGDAGVTSGPVAAAEIVGRVLAVARGDAPRHDLVGVWRVARTAQRLRLERRRG
jgi:tRNA(Ile)-lysidine synthase